MDNLTAVGPMYRLSTVILVLALTLSSGCAVIRSSTHAHVNSDDPRQEIWETKKCAPSVYPLMYSAGICSDLFKEAHAQPDSGSRISYGIAASVVCVTFGTVAESVLLPFTLPAALFSSECETTTAARPNKRYVAGKPAKLTLARLAFADPIDSGVLQAGEGGKISFVLTNDAGAGRAEDLEAKISASPPNDLTFSHVQKIGDLGPGDSTPVQLDIEAADALRDGQVTFAINFHEAGRNPPDPARIQINTRALRPPRFKIARIAMDDGSPTDPKRLALGNGNGVLDPGESVELTVTLANIGAGPAEAVSVALTGDDSADLHVLESERFQRKYSIGRLRMNESDRVTFAVSVSRLYHGPTALPLTLQVSERRGRFDTKIPLGIRVGQRMPHTELLAVQPAMTASDAPADTTANAECMPSFYVRLPRDSVWFYGAGKGTTVSEAREKALDALALQAGGVDAISGFEQDDAAACAGAAYVMVRVEKTAARKVARVPGQKIGGKNGN